MKKIISNLTVLENKQTINAEIKKFSKTQPQRPNPWNKRKTMVDESKMTKADRLKMDELYKQLINIDEIIELSAKNIKKGDNVYYLNDTNKILEATVVSIGKYKNDYNDLSGFIRIKNDKHSWFHSDHSIVKK